MNWASWFSCWLCYESGYAISCSGAMGHRAPCLLRKGRRWRVWHHAGKKRRVLMRTGRNRAGSVCQRGRGIALARPYAVRRNKKTPVRVFIVLVAGAGFEPTTFGL